MPARRLQNARATMGSDEPPVSGSVPDDGDVGAGLPAAGCVVVGSGVDPPVAKIAVGGSVVTLGSVATVRSSSWRGCVVGGGVVAIAAGPQIAPHSVAVDTVVAAVAGADVSVG
jgi:hypothetical protein